MENVDILLLGGTVVTMNDRYEIIRDGAVAIRGTEIAAVGSRESVEQHYSASHHIDCSGQYVLPGLINAHTHVPMTLLRGLADDLRLDVWLMGYIMPVEREFVSPEFCRLGTLLACAEMIRGGVTSFIDMYYFESDIAEATAQAGMRALLGETVLKFPAPDAATYEESLAYSRRFIEKWRDHPLITPTVAPHAPYSNTEETMKACAALAAEFDLPLITHIAETRREQDDSLEAYGETVVPWVRDLNVFDVPTTAAHCVHVDEHEMRMLHDEDVVVAHCPSANLKLSSGIAPIAHMVDLGITVAIGTDGPASNNDLDLFEEMRLAALVAKVNPPNPLAVPARRALEMATRGGAKAMRKEDLIGSLEVGKLADIIVVDAHPVHNSPHFNVSQDAVYSQIVYATKSSDVRHVICNGKTLMHNRELLTVDLEAVQAEAAAYAQKIGAFVTAREENALSKLIAVGVDVERAESFELQLKANLDDASRIEELLSHEDVQVLRNVHYRQYDTYFLFDGPESARVRYREDDKVALDGSVESVRMRLTYTSGESERDFHDVVLLSHSRFIAPASHPLRFYEEYFQASRQVRLQKERRRWHVLYKGVLFYINIDRLQKPKSDGLFIEIKSRTWSMSDAEVKADYIVEMMSILGINTEEVVRTEYLDMEVGQ